MLEIGLGISFFTLIVLILVFIILVARARLCPVGDAKVLINNEKEVSVSHRHEIISRSINE